MSQEGRSEAQVEEARDQPAQTAGTEPVAAGYFTSWNFIGAITGLTLSIVCGFGGWTLAANSLTTIKEELGATDDYFWIPLTYTVVNAIGYILFGRLSDIFGRRWFVLGGNVLTVIGSVVAATAPNVRSLIASNVLIGFGGAVQLSFAVTLGELVPKKHRALVSVLHVVFPLPVNCFGPVVAKAFIVGTDAGWRWSYYLNIITGGLACILLFLFYYPPTFSMLQKRQTVRQKIQSLDYGGILLVTSGIVLFLLGLNWGGSEYPWASARVLATLIIGTVVIVAFVVYEAFVPSEPLIPISLMRNVQCMLYILIASVGGMVYYSMGILWPQIVSTLYTDDPTYQGWLAMSNTGGTAAGNIVSSLVFTPIGHFNHQLVGSTLLVTAFYGALASTTQYNKNQTIIFSVFATFFAGWLENPTMAAVTFTVDPADLGLAVCALNAIRVASGGIASAIYKSILTNRTNSLRGRLIPTAAVEAGLPSSSIPLLLDALAAGTNLTTAVPGINNQILSAVTNAEKTAFSGGLQLVFLVTIAFGGLGIIMSACTRNLDPHLTDEVSRTLHTRHTQAGQKEVEEKTDISP